MPPIKIQIEALKPLPELGNALSEVLQGIKSIIEDHKLLDFIILVLLAHIKKKLYFYQYENLRYEDSGLLWINKQHCYPSTPCPS